MNKIIDLHTHSTASDGTFTPARLVQLAAENGLAALALTDHDSVDGICEALAAGETYGVEVVPGVELSTDYQGCEIHVVGLYIDCCSGILCSQLRAFRENRDTRNLKMVNQLREEGFSITAEKLYKRYPGAVLTRAHIARFLVDTGQVRDISEVFAKYIGQGCRCYVDRLKITPVRAVELIRAAGGFAVLAHPCLYRLTEKEMRVMVAEMKEAGLGAIEAVYSRNGAGDEEKFRRLAKQFGLLISGGSDFHGGNKPDIRLGIGTGNLCLPYNILDEIKRVHFAERGAEAAKR